MTTVTVALVNGRIRTNDARRPMADAVAIAGEHVALVGSSAEVRKFAGPAARVIDLRGAIVEPEPAEALLRRGAPANVVVRAAPGERAELLRMHAGRIIADDFA